MTELQIKILNDCSNQTYIALVEKYGIADISFLLRNNYITVTTNKTVIKTELGVNASKNLSATTNENFGKNGNQLLLS